MAARCKIQQNCCRFDYQDHRPLPLTGSYARHDQGIYRDCVGRHTSFSHRVECRNGARWLVALPADADHGIVGDYVGYHQLPLCCFEHLKDPLGLSAFIASTHQCAVSDYVGHHLIPLHCLNCIIGPLGPLALLTGARQGAVLICGSMPCHYVAMNTSRAGSGCLPFTQALIRAL